MTTSDDEMLDLCGADETTTAAARSSLNRTKPAVDTTENSSSPNNSGDQQSINRKWVKQMKRRIREFVSNSSHIGSGDRASGSAGELNSCELSSTLVDSSSSSALSNSAATAAADRLLPHDLASRVNRNFGVRLDKCEPSSISPYIPVVIEICTRLIELHVNDEGLYRKVGQKQVVASLRSQLNNGVMQINITDINWNNPHAVVSLLKCFLNQLPDSLTTSRLYPEFIRVCRVEAHSMRLNLIKQLLSRLPRHNYETLKYLCAHLRRVATAYQHNKMTIKNLCIAFSQSIIRHNEANCETIKSDHLIQSQLMELILIYYDWLFDPSHIGEIPEEIKEPCEQHLFQQYCFHNLPLSYADMLANIIKSLKANRTSSAYFMTNNSPIVNKIVPNSPKSPQLSSEAAKNASSKSSLMRSAKSIGNMPRYKTSPSEYQKKDSPKVTVKSSMTKSQNHANKNTKQRSKSVDVRLRSLFCATSHSIDAKKNKPTSPPPILQKSSTQDDSRIIGGKNQRTSCLLRFTNPLKANSPTTRKSYDSLAWTQNNDVKQPAMKTTTSNTVDFKQLEKKHERERELLAEIMAKLELDLAQAKKELNEEDDLVRCSMLLSDGLKHKYQKAQYKTSSPTKFKSHTTTNQANSANNNNQASSSSTGRSTSSLSSSGVSPHTNVLVATTTKASKTTTTSLFLQSPQSSSSTSSSDDFVIVSPKLNRNRTTATVANQGAKKYHSKKQSVKSATTTSSNMIIRRHTIALGTVDQESSSSTSPPNNGGYICKLKRLNEVSKRTEISRGLVTRRDQNRCRLTSKSATNLIYSVGGGQQIKSSPQQQAANTDEDEDQKAAVKKTILNLSPLSISASSVSSSSASAASANDIQPSNSNSSRSSLMSENNKAAAAVQKNLVTSLADEVGSVSKMSSATTPTTTITKQKFESLI